MRNQEIRDLEEVFRGLNNEEAASNLQDSALGYLWQPSISILVS